MSLTELGLGGNTHKTVVTARPWEQVEKKGRIWCAGEQPRRSLGTPVLFPADPLPQGS